MSEIKAREVVLVLIDISGYTQFMVANKKTIHSHLIITDLLRKIIDEVKVPLRVFKLEGDAVLLYAAKRSDRSWDEDKKIIGARLEQFFLVFSSELIKLADSKLCKCNMCKNISKLKLKVIVHSGEALFHSIRGYRELGGVDPIKIHRLLKNSVPAHHYILLSQEAKHDIAFPYEHDLIEHIEEIDDFGKVKTYIYIPDDPFLCPILHPVSVRKSVE